RSDPEVRILLATDAAGEGVNLQNANLMVNYDLPWNPNRLEQRMGRIHRYGQKKDVLISNLIAQETIEGEVFNILFKKIEYIKEAFGKDRVFDVLGETVTAKKLRDLIIEAIA